MRFVLICLKVFCWVFFYVYWFFFRRSFLMFFVLFVRWFENLLSWFIMFRNVFIFCIFVGGGRFVIVLILFGLILILFELMICFRNLICLVLKIYLLRLSVMLVFNRCFRIVFSFLLCCCWFLLWISMLFMLYFIFFKFNRIWFMVFWNFFELELILKGNILK